MTDATSAGDTPELQAPPTKTRQRNPRGAGNRLRTEIIEAAIRVLARLGADEPFSLRGVAKEAMITAPSVYLHFTDKTVLLMAAIEQLFQQVAAYQDAAEVDARTSGANAWEILLARSHAYVRFGLENPGHYRVLYDGRAILRLDDPRTVAFGLPVLFQTAALISDVPTASATPPTEAEAERLALLLWTSLHGIVSLHINKPTIEWPSPYTLAEQMMQSLIRPT